MSRVRRTGLIAGLLAGAVVLRAAEPPWIEVQSPHFTVVGNASEKTARRVAWQFEQVRETLRQLWPWARIDSGRPVVVFAARDEATLRSLAPEFWERKGYRPVSVFVTGVDRHYALIRTDLPEPDEEGENPCFNAYRAYANVVLSSSFRGDLPFWLRRGLGELYGNTVVRAKEVQVGRLLPGHLRLLRSQSRLSLRELVAADAGSRYGTQESDAQAFSAQSWAFVHYLRFGEQAAHASKLGRLLALLHEGRRGEEAVREALGDPGGYEAGFSGYLGQRLFGYGRMKIAVEVKEEAYLARLLTGAESATRRARAHVAMGRPLEARALAEEAKKADAQLPGPWEVEALLLEREGDAEKARAAYEKAVTLGSPSAYVHYRHAQLIWTPRADRATLEKVASSLQKAVELDPSSANAYSFLAETQMALGAAEEGLGLARRAVSLQPREAYHRLAVARLLSHLQRREEALQEAKAALELSDSPENHRAAQDLLDFLGQVPAISTRSAVRTRDVSAACLQAREADACAKLAPSVETACAAGLATACAALAFLLESGLGVTIDVARAAALYRKACDGGDAQACERLRSMPK